MWDSSLKNGSENRKGSRLFRYLLSAALVLLVLGYGVFPLVFRYSTYVKSNLTFLNFVKLTHHTDFHRPRNFGLEGGRNFYLSTSDGITLGVWHSLPKELQPFTRHLDLNDPYNTSVIDQYNSWLNNGTVFLYFHGSGGSRASRGRTKMYQLLNSLNYHVVTFDYRGYGDSTGRPRTEGDVVEDAKTVYAWLLKHIHSGKIFFWGHSLGTGVMTHLLAQLEQRAEQKVVAAVLESSFNNMADALRTYPPSRPYSSLPGFDFFAVEPMNMHNLTFLSEEFVHRISCPLLFLHAQDDHVVPHRLGVKLYEAAISSRTDQSSVSFVSYGKEMHLGHTKIYKDPNLGQRIQVFVEESIRKARNDSHVIQI